MATLLDEFKSITEALNEAKIDYAVCGGWAMAIHGLTRSTIDIDLLIAADDLEQAWALAKLRGYDVEGSPLSFADGAIEIRRRSKVESETETLFTIDLLLVTPKLREVWDDREQVSWEQGKIWVVSRRGLIKLKQISGRDQDLVDITQLEEEK